MSLLGLLALLGRLNDPPTIANMIGTRRGGLASFSLLRSLASRSRDAPSVTKTLHEMFIIKVWLSWLLKKEKNHIILDKLHPKYGLLGQLGLRLQ